MKRFVLVATGLALFGWLDSGEAQTFLNKSAAQWRDALKNGPSEKAQRSAAFALGKIGAASEIAVPDLIAKLGTAPPAVQEAAAFALGNIAKASDSVRKRPDVLAALRAALKHKESLVRRSAAYSLGCLGDQAQAAVADLNVAMDDSKPEVKQNVAWALGQLKSSDGVLGLQKALRDGDPQVRRDAAAAIEDLPSAAIRAALTDLVTSCSMPGVRTEILAEIRKPALRALAKVVNGKDTQAVGMLKSLLAEANIDPEVRLNSAMVLAKIGGPDAKAAIRSLQDALKSNDQETRRQAMAALSGIADAAPELLDDLMAALSSPDAEIRKYAASGLGSMAKAGERAVPLLVKHVTDRNEDVDVRMEAATSLSTIGPVPPAVDAIPTLLKTLSDQSDKAKVRERVIWALRVHGLEPLSQMKNVLDAFENILEEPRQPKITMLYFDSAYMLGLIKGSKASKKTLDVLLEFLKDSSTQIYVGKTREVALGGLEAKNEADRKILDTGTGDGRIMPIQALTRIARESKNMVAGRPDILQQLRVIANDASLWSKLTKETKDLLELVGG